MKSIKIYTLILIALALTTTSCDSLLDTDSKDSLPEDKVKSEAGCNALLLGIYDMMQEEIYYGRDMIAIPEVLADNAKISPQGTRYNGIADNAVGEHIDIWETSYKMINLANEVLQYANELPKSDKVNSLKGEALALRGLLYMNLSISYSREPKYLVNNFDLDVPLVTKPFYYTGGALEEDVFPARSTVSATWGMIENDLTTAFSLLENNDSSKAPKRIGAVATKALLARAYMYQSKWKECKAAADDAISNSGISIYDGTYTKIFSENRESIFYLNFAPNEALGSGSLHSTYGMTPSDKDSEGYDIAKGSGDATLCVPSDLMSMYDADKDIRFGAFRKAIIAGTKIWWTTKFFSWGGTFGQDNIPVIRISELYLMRAEANAELKEYATARADIDALRTKRGLEPTTVTNAALLDEILLQRRLELAFEGFRFFDLKRRGMDISKPESKPAVPYTDFRVVAKISNVQILANKKLQNNPGY